jgi:hypothetical protein
LGLKLRVSLNSIDNRLIKQDILIGNSKHFDIARRNAMPLSDDLGDLTKFMLSLVEEPKRLEEYRQDPKTTIDAAKLSRGARELIDQAAAGGDTVVVVVVVVIV